MTDEMLMEAVRDGDLEKASVLFERYHKRVYNFLARMTGDRDTAEDLAQNVFLRMIRYRASFKDGSRFVPWIFQIARNVFADHFKTEKNNKNRYFDVETVQDQLGDARWDDQDHEKEELLRRSMALLSADQRELLVLTRFQHLKYEEVAIMLDTTVSNVKVKVHRAIMKLREHYFELNKI